jgi:putative membrane protein
MKQVVKYLILTLKGIVYGVTNLLPGIGGGLILIILGIYQEFVSSVGNFFLELRNWRKNLAFIIPMLLGAGIGMVVFAKGVTYVMDQFPVVSMFLFMGLVVGTIPSVLKQTADMKLTVGRGVALLAGILVVILFKFAERRSLSAGWSTNANSVGGFLYFFISNLLAGGASVTPGMDGSYVWMLTGIFDKVMAAIGSVTGLKALFAAGGGGLGIALGSIHWAVLLATGIGAVVGIIFFSKLIDIAIKRVPSITYYVVLGLVIASIYGLWPSTIENGLLWPIGAVVKPLDILWIILAFGVGLAVTLLAGSRPEARQPDENKG